MPVNVCLRVTIMEDPGAAFPAKFPVPVNGVLTPATPMRAEFRRVVTAEAGVRAGGRGALRGVIMGGGNAGLENVSMLFDTIPFFSVLIRIMEDRLQPEVSSKAKLAALVLMTSRASSAKKAWASIHSFPFEGKLSFASSISISGVGDR